jgi:hypothetical protein
MPIVDPPAGDPSKVTAALVREARSLQRRADKLTSGVRATDDETTTRAAGEALHAVERLVHQLTCLQQSQQRRAREAIRRGR